MIDIFKNILQNAAHYGSLSAPDILNDVMTKLGHAMVQANSLGAEDVVILHMMHEIDPGFKSFTLDTGRLNPETYEVLGRLQEKYRLDIEILFPEREAVEKMVKEKGINLFYDSVENRQLCCHVRKVEPLSRVLKKYSGWICGLRREQSSTRSAVSVIEKDDAHGGMLKVNPLANWTRQEVWDYIQKNSIPYNRLFDQGYASIGCAPCTQAIKAGEDERAGRWWWEDPNNKECGLHTKSSLQKPL